MKRNVAVVIFGAVMAALVVTTMACGSELEAVDQPELQVEHLELQLPEVGPSDRSRSFPEGLHLRNAGEGELEVTSVEWIDRPSRVEAFHGDNLECGGDSDCGEQGFCNADGLCECESTAQCPSDAVCLTQSSRCRATGFRSLPESVRSDSTFSHNLIVVDDEDEPVNCPETDAADAPSNYCGAIEVETNARNSAEQVANGTATVYLVAEEGSGSLELPSTFMEFTEASPGEMQTQQFEAVNAAASELEFFEINFSSNSSWFEVSPPPHEITIEEHGSTMITVEMTPPSDATEDELDFNTGLTFNTSSITTEPAMTVSVTPGIGDAPMIEVYPMQLSFEDGPSQTLEIRNHGAAALPLNSMEIRDVDEDIYDVYYDGTDVVADHTALPTVSPASGGDPSVEEFTVEFDAGAVTDTAIGILRINHQDTLAGNRTEVDLLGDSSDVALGEVSPPQLFFQANQTEGDEQERELAVVNLGNADLVIDEVELDAIGGTTNTEYFEVDGLDPGTAIGPGEIDGAILRYTGSTQMEQSLAVRIQSNHDGASNMMVANVSATELTESTMDIDIEPSFPDTAQVDEGATFGVVDGADQAQLQFATWTVHERPAGSVASIEGTGEEVSMVPDEAGEYRISVTVEDSANRQVQKMLTFEAQ